MIELPKQKAATRFGYDYNSFGDTNYDFLSSQPFSFKHSVIPFPIPRDPIFISQNQYRNKFDLKNGMQKQINMKKEIQNDSLKFENCKDNKNEFVRFASLGNSSFNFKYFENFYNENTFYIGVLKQGITFVKVFGDINKKISLPGQAERILFMNNNLFAKTSEGLSVVCLKDFDNEYSKTFDTKNYKKSYFKESSDYKEADFHKTEHKSLDDEYRNDLTEITTLNGQFSVHKTLDDDKRTKCKDSKSLKDYQDIFCKNLTNSYTHNEAAYNIDCGLVDFCTIPSTGEVCIIRPDRIEILNGSSVPISCESVQSIGATAHPRTFFVVYNTNTHCLIDLRMSQVAHVYGVSLSSFRFDSTNNTIIGKMFDRSSQTLLCYENLRFNENSHIEINGLADRFSFYGTQTLFSQLNNFYYYDFSTGEKSWFSVDFPSYKNHCLKRDFIYYATQNGIIKQNRKGEQEFMNVDLYTDFRNNDLHEIKDISSFFDMHVVSEYDVQACENVFEAIFNKKDLDSQLIGPYVGLNGNFSYRYLEQENTVPKWLRPHVFNKESKPPFNNDNVEDFHTDLMLEDKKIMQNLIKNKLLKNQTEKTNSFNKINELEINTHQIQLESKNENHRVDSKDTFDADCIFQEFNKHLKEKLQNMKDDIQYTEKHQSKIFSQSFLDGIEKSKEWIKEELKADFHRDAFKKTGEDEVQDIIKKSSY